MSDDGRPAEIFPFPARSGLTRPQLADAFAACFATPAGVVVLDQLRRVFLDRRVPPTASDAELRHVEGQRAVVAWIMAMARASHAER